MKNTINTNIREYNEERVVEIDKFDDYEIKDTPELCDRLLLVAFNEGGHNNVRIDLVDIIEWVKKNKPELLK
jgi:hypothetical protein